MEVYVNTSHNQKKDNNKFKNKKQPELTENRTVWKSNNQGVKEETFIQTGRRARDWKPKQRTQGEVAAGGLGQARQQLADWARWWLVVPHYCADKPGGIPGN